MAKRIVEGYKCIILEKEPPIARIILNRPEKLNALDGQAPSVNLPPDTILGELPRAAEDVEADPEIRVVIVKGNGRAFSAGFDIDLSSSNDYMTKLGPLEWAKLEASLTRVFTRAIWENEKPFIAQVHGFCLAGGLDLQGACDITICSGDTVFGYPAVRYGSIPTCSFWPGLIGYKKFKEMVYTGRSFSAQEMYDFGLVNKVVPRDQLEDEVELMAKSIALVPETSVYFGKIYSRNLVESSGIRPFIALMNAAGGTIHTQPGVKQEFNKAVLEKGLKEALRERDAKFSEIDKASEKLRARKLV